MIFSKELMNKGKAASSADELRKLAQDHGIELSSADAETYYRFLTETDDGLSDEELEQVTGGKGSATPEPKYHEGQELWVGYPTSQTYQGIVVLYPEFYDGKNGWRYLIRKETGFNDNFYLETEKYIHTFKPEKWIY